MTHKSMTHKPIEGAKTEGFKIVTVGFTPSRPDLIHDRDKPFFVEAPNKDRASEAGPLPKLFPNRTQAKSKYWTSLFQSQGPSRMMKLDHYPTLQQGKKAVVEIDDADLDTTSWNHCLVGHFLDGKMPYPLLSATAQRVWRDQLNSVNQIGSKFIFEFKDEASKLSALESGPHFFFRRYLVLKEWHRLMIPTLEHLSTIPAWIKIHKLPLEFWTAESFSRIASTIGKPLHVDKNTEKRKRLDYARMCVGIEAGSELPDDIQITVNGQSVVVAIKYQWLPPICSPFTFRLNSLQDRNYTTERIL